MRRLLGDEFEVVTATSFEEAVEALDYRVDVIVLGYHFDEMRPYRLLRYLRDDRPMSARVLLVRGLAFESLTIDEAETARTYKDLGVEAYLALDKVATGDRFDEAASALRQAVRKAITNSQERQQSTSRRGRPI